MGCPSIGAGIPSGGIMSEIEAKIVDERQRMNMMLGTFEYRFNFYVVCGYRIANEIKKSEQYRPISLIAEKTTFAIFNMPVIESTDVEQDEIKLMVELKY